MSLPSKQPRKLALAALLLASSGLCAPLAHAQEAGGEIVVTAQKRAERLQDVPLAVTALSAASLAERQINDTSALVAASPSLTFQQGNNPTNTTFRIRGIGTSLFSQGVEASVSVVVDGVVAARQAQNFIDLGDIERVEVLRGPQGTLFGKNATAGVINVVTAKPSDTLQAQFNATAAQDNEYRVSGSVSGPIAPGLKLRVTAYDNDVGGYAWNVKTQRKVNGSKSWGVRSKLEWDASENLTFLLAGDYRKSHADGANGILVQANNPKKILFNGGARIAADSNELSNNGATYANSTQKTFSLQSDLNLGFATLTAITAYQDFNLDNNFEADRIGFDTPVFIAAAASAQFDYNRGATRIHQFSQELRLASKPGQRLNYVVGAYYSSLNLDRDFARRAALCSTGTVGQACTPTSYRSLASHAVNKTDSISAFGQLDYRLWHNVKAIGGARLQYEKSSVFGQRTGVMVAGDTPFGGTASAWAGRSVSDVALTGKLGLQNEFSRRAQVYATFTRGYKGYGLDTEIGTDFANQTPVRPEYVSAYEVGFKGQTADGKLNVAVAAYLANYTDLQIQANRSDPTTSLISYVQTNAGSAKTKGVEVEASYRPFKGLSLNAGVTYSDARVNADGLNCPTQYQAAAATYAVGAAHPVNTCYKYQYVTASGVTVTSGALQDVRNGLLPASPAWRLQFSPRFEHEVAAGLNGFAQIDYSYQSSEGFAIEQDPLLTQKGYSLVDLSFGIRQPEGHYSLTFYVKNLFDQNFYTSMASSTLFPSNTTTLDIYANRPKNADRYLGATLGVKL
jgi:iron complex outermembrane receptor protein